MSKDVLKNVTGVVEEHLPEILTAAGIGTGLCTIGFSMFGGWKIHEIMKDEKKDTKEKRWGVVKIVIPVAAGTALMVVCHVSASKVYMRRIAELGALYAASKVDLKEFKKEVGKIVGDDKVEVIDKKMEAEKVVHPTAPANEKIRIYDEVTGYQFECTMLEFWNAVNKMNDMAAYETVRISDFYEELLGYDYENPSTHNHVCFGGDESSVGTEYISCLMPSFGSRLDDNMQLMYTIKYPYAQC